MYSWPSGRWQHTVNVPEKSQRRFESFTVRKQIQNNEYYSKTNYRCTT